MFRKLVKKELKKIRKVHSLVASHHEGYAILLEELDEYKNEVWKKDSKRNKQNMIEELVQVAAVAERIVEDLLEKP